MKRSFLQNGKYREMQKLLTAFYERSAPRNAALDSSTGALDAYLHRRYRDDTELSVNADLLGVLFDGDIVPTVAQMEVRKKGCVLL